MLSDRLDSWVADPAVRTHHVRTSAAAADRVWAAAREVRLCDTRTLGRLVRWRIPGVAADCTFDALFRGYPFTLLDEGEDYTLSGLCGRIWTLQRDYPRLDGPDAFAAWSQPGTVRVLLAHWTEPTAGGGSRLVSETRVEPTDRRARLRLRALWTVMGRFERLVGAEPLTLAVRRAEDPAPTRPGPTRR